LTQPIQQTHARGLLIVVEPFYSGPLGGETPGMSDADVRGLLDWVARGNTLVLASRWRTLLHEKLGVTLPPPARNDEAPRAVDQVEFSGYTQGIERLTVEGRGTVAARGGVPLWWVGDRPGAVLLAHGSGRVLVLPDPSMWTHRGLLRGDNVVLLYNVSAREARDDLVYFDEYHHGIRSGSGYWGYLRRHNQHWGALQLLAVFAVGAWAIGVRLGPAVPAPSGPSADAVDYASAVARIYQKAGVRHLLAEKMARDFLDSVAAHLRLKRSASPAELMAAWRRRHLDGVSRDQLQELLRAVGELRQAGRLMSDADLLAWARAFDEFVSQARERV
jgi:hypothetical protein